MTLGKFQIFLWVKILVTSALPYANGDIHLGHLSGCYLPADIYTRYHRLKGEDIIHVCGTDEHGVPCLIRAEKEGISPKELVDRYHGSIKNSFVALGIEFDNFSRTTLPHHHKLAQNFFLKLYNSGYIFSKTIERFYCPSCKKFLPDRYIEGTCPNCGNKEARGDECEVCGRWLEPELLIEPKCKICSASPILKSTKHWFFDLPKFQERLKEWLSSKKNWKPNVFEFCQNWLREGLEPRAISRDLPWGVSVPLKEAKEKVLYVWFEALIGYISSTIEWAEKRNTPEEWKNYWLDPKTKLIHFIGKDNIAFHAIVWPAMLMGYQDFILPSEIPANEFLNLEARPFSTSRNWVIWVPDCLSEFSPDSIRYALAINLPENRDVDFTWKDFQARNNNELADIFGNYVNRVALFTKKYFGGEIKKPENLKPEDEEFLKKIDENIKTIEKLIENFEIKSSAREWMNLAALGNRYFDYQQPWRKIKENKKDAERVIGVCWKLISSLGVISNPYIPFTAEKIEKMLGFKKRKWEDAYKKELPSIMNKPEILFKKIEDEKIELQIKKLKKEKTVKIEDFEKINLIVARIEKGERIEGTDKLVKLMVNIGKERRTIVAGIAKHYPPEKLIGKYVVVVTNLEPVKIRGVTSHGMLLAAMDGENISLLVPDKEIKVGSKVV